MATGSPAQGPPPEVIFLIRHAEKRAQLAKAIVANDTGTSLVAREHDHIPDIAANIVAVTGVVVATVWPGDRFDIIWCFTLAAKDVAAYHFTTLPELLLSGDALA